MNRNRQPTVHSEYQLLPTDEDIRIRGGGEGGKPRTRPPKRTTKTSQKMTLFPDEDTIKPGEVTDDDVYNQLGQIPFGTERRDLERLKTLDREQLPRVTAYCTASFYRLDDVFKFLQLERNKYKTHPKRFDECIYTPFTSSLANSTLIDVDGPGGGLYTSPGYGSETEGGGSFSIDSIEKELFFFEYGVVVCWGLSKEEEKAVLKLLVPFEEDKIAEEDIEEEILYFVYSSTHQRIYNDIITLKSRKNVMAKLTISHAVAQSAKTTLFEDLVEDTIEDTKHIPQEMARTGNINLSRAGISKKIGQLFIMRINVNLVSNVLDEPEIFWSEPSLQPLYQAVRGYLEISQRAELLNQRVEVIGDMLDMLKEHLNYSHSEKLEWIVIYLITIEVVIGLFTVFFEFLNFSKGE